MYEPLTIAETFFWTVLLMAGMTAIGVLFATADLIVEWLQSRKWRRS